MSNDVLQHWEDINLGPLPEPLYVTGGLPDVAIIALFDEWHSEYDSGDPHVGVEERVAEFREWLATRLRGGTAVLTNDDREVLAEFHRQEQQP